MARVEKEKFWEWMWKIIWYLFFCGVVGEKRFNGYFLL